ncbi:13958_t:CDS:1 [Acaulospora colombiana]|uniref:13958_t:CDS:1 n=1 Tax=Acaulospora colombiana TaxID=27376 RepID=A0ACA9KI34_9GLOM|nr:13958_t:CDS:1 [Acaulospora colombiana]
MLVKGNDMELFHFLSGGPLVIQEAKIRLIQNVKLIKELILEMKFIPFPPRPKLKFAVTVEYLQLVKSMAQEEYPPRDGHENSRQLNVIARAILIFPDLVKDWISIGYLQICRDVNDLVLQGALLIFFPPNSPEDYDQQNMNDVVEKLKQLTELGFELSASVMADVLCIFEDKLNRIGDILIESFREVHHKSGSQIASECLKEVVKPEKNLKRRDVLIFLKKNVGNEIQPEVNRILDHYYVGMRKSDLKDLDESVEIIAPKLCSLFYKWILEEFGSESETARKCFDNIILVRVWIDIKTKEFPRQTVPKSMASYACTEICTLYEEFCKNEVPFQSDHLELISRANSKEVIQPLFGYLFHALDKDESHWISLSDGEKEVANKRKNVEHDLKVYDLIIADWIDDLIVMRNEISNNPNSNFKDQYMDFWNRLISKRIYDDLLRTNVEGRLSKRLKHAEV